MATLRKMKTLLADTNYSERIEHASTTSKDVGWQNWFQSYPVHAELEGLMNNVAKAMPSAKFYPAEFTRRMENDKTHYLVNEFSVYMDEYPFDFGRVGFRDYAVGRGDSRGKPPTFGIYSRKIHNTKYSDGRDQFHMVMTASADKAVKLAGKYLVPYTNRELAQAYYKGVQREMDKARHDAHKEMNNLVGDTINRMDNNAIAMEIVSLMAQGAKFATQGFKDIADRVHAVTDKVKEENARKVDAWFVRLRKVGEDTYVDVQVADDVRKNDYKPSLVGQPTTYPEKEVPEDLLGSISVLSILEDGQYVPRVGLKIDERTFWVERG